MNQQHRLDLIRPYIDALLVAIGVLLVAVSAAIFTAGAALAEARSISREDLARIFPGADAAGPFEGQPEAAEIRRDGRIVGYAVSTYDVVGSTGYSGKPLDVLVGIDLQGIITGALLVRQTEPILVIGITEQQIRDYVGGFAGFDIGLRGTLKTEPGGAKRYPEAISGATISSGVIRDAVIRSARAVAASRGLGGTSPAAGRIDVATFAPATWPELTADGSIDCRSFSRRDLEEGDQPTPSDAGDRFLDVCVALLTPARIGENLLGKLDFNRLIAGLAADDQAILIAANGLFSVKGTAFVRSQRFERLQIVQGERTYALTTDGYANVESLRIEGAPAFREIGVFVIRAGAGFDPSAPWRLEILVPEDASGTGAPAVLSVSYGLPDRYLLAPAVTADETSVSGAPLWQQNWRKRWPAIIIVSLMLAALTAILVFQDPVIQRPLLYHRLRLTFLAVTLVWLGWYAGGQLSVVNVLTFAHSLMTDFKWEFFLLDPVIFILWSYVAVVLLFWGRGVFCGWLCPFGALQEFASEAARRLRLPQVRVPFALHERLWPIKYVVFLGLFAVSLTSTELAFVGAEVEPFKTAISLKFVREWPFVLYAVGLLGAGLFIERFFCRYLCPLGAALAIPARLRMFEWLKRRPQCGRECQICFQRCPSRPFIRRGRSIPTNASTACSVSASTPMTVCPPLAARRKRRERREALMTGRSGAMEEA